MKIEVDRDKCIEGCFLCFESCPKLSKEVIEKHSKEKLFNFLNSSTLSQGIIDKCPEKAFEEPSKGIQTINREKCSECGLCGEDGSPILLDRNTPLKCDLCIEETDYRCIKTCPYGALNLVQTEKEKEEIKRKIGYTVKDYTKLKKISGKIFKVKEHNEPIYITGEENFNIQEARTVHEILKKVREEKLNGEEIEAKVEEQCIQKNIEIDTDHVEKLSRYIERELSGLSILKNILEDNELEEISIIGPNKPIYIYHREKGWLKTDLVIKNSEKIKNLINKSARNLNRRITLKEPRINANIDEGRVHGAIKPLVTTGNCMTIRKFITNKFKPNDLVKNKTLSKEVMNLLKKTIKCNTNILIAGNTGSGKTTTLNTLLHFLPKNERIIMVEETPEINPPQEHVIKLVTSKDLEIEMHELVTDTLRMRPDRVIVGEVRSEKEAKALMNTMLAGQGKGSIATFHGNSSQEALTRLIGLGINENDLKSIDLILVQKRWTNHSRKNVKEERKVTEVSSLRKNSSKPVVIYNDTKGLQLNELKKTKLMEKLSLSYGKSKEELIQEIKEVEEY